jgi:hypothetical protein
MSDNTNAVVNMAADYTVNTPVRLKEHILVTLDSYTCEMADDEGPDNTLEIDRLWVYANPFNKASDPGSNIFPAAQPVAWYSSSGDGWRATSGLTWDWNDGNTLDIIFETDPDLGFDFNQAKIDFTGYARDYDTTSANESGNGALTLTGDHFFDNDGKHSFTMESPDFIIRANIVITRVP